MRRAVLIAAVALGSGCVLESSSNGSAVLYWSFWATASHGTIGSVDATATKVCSLAGVDEVRITLTDPAGVVSTDSGPCITGNDVPGVRYTGLLAGTWDYYVEGRRAGARVFDQLGSFDVFDGSETVKDTRPAAIYGDLEVDFAVPTCVATDTLKFDLNGATQLVYSTYAGTTNPPVSVGCLPVSSAPWTVPSVPAGGYTLTNVVQLSSAGTALHFASCIPTWTQAASSKVIAVTVDAAAAPAAPGGYCPQ